MPLISACSGNRGRQRQEYFYEFEASLVFMVSFKPTRTIQCDSFSKTNKNLLSSPHVQKADLSGPGNRGCQSLQSMVLDLWSHGQPSFRCFSGYPLRNFPCVWRERDWGVNSVVWLRSLHYPPSFKPMCVVLTRPRLPGRSRCFDLPCVVCLSV